MGIPGLLNIGANWRRAASRSRAGLGLNRVRATASAARMLRGVGYPGGQSFNRGAVSQSIDDGVVTIKHREYIGTVNSSVDFVTNVYEMNPGLDRTFPWASGIANQFQQYKIRSMCWEFVSTAATSLVSGTNTALGQVAIATQYDSLATPFANLGEMLNSQWATSTKISENLLHPIECEKGQTTSMPQYVRNAPAPSNSDIRLYDLGRTTIATYGAQAANQIGQLYISYVIELYKPISTAQTGADQENAFYTLFPGSSVGVTTFAAGYWLGQTRTKRWDSIGLTFDVSVPTLPKISWPVGSAGYYYVQLTWFSQPPLSGNNIAGTMTAVNGSVVTGFWNDGVGGKTFAGSPTVNPNTNFSPSFFVYIPDPSRQFVLTINADWFLAGYNRADDVGNLIVMQCYSGASFSSEDEKDELTTLREQMSELRALFAGMSPLEDQKDDEGESEHVEDLLYHLMQPLADPAAEAERKGLMAKLQALVGSDDDPDVGEVETAPELSEQGPDGSWTRLEAEKTPVPPPFPLASAPAPVSPLPVSKIRRAPKLAPRPT